MEKRTKFFFLNILKFLENEKYPTVSPHLRLLGFTGLWQSNVTSPFYSFKKLLFYTVITFFFSQYTKCVINFNIESLTLLLQYAPFHMGIVKSCFFKKQYKNWKRFIDYMSSIERDELERNDKEILGIITTYIRKSRYITYFFWSLAILTNCGLFTMPYGKNQAIQAENSSVIYTKIFNGYTPFNQEEPPGYYVSMAIQTVLGHIVSAYVVGWDTLVVSIMMFFTGQLKIARVLCVRIIDKRGDPDESYRKIVECHRFYISLVSYQKLFNETISSVMFLYLIVISVNLGVCIIQISKIHDDFKALLFNVVFLAACLIQLLLFYWYANEVTEESNLVSYGTFESQWVDSKVNRQKEVALLGLATKKKMIFTAGPFNDITLSTFILILRASYSFYTLLKNTSS